MSCETDKIPKKWMDDQLGNVCDVLTGFPFKSSHFSKKEENIKLVRGDNVKERKLVWGDKARYWDSVTDDLKKYLLKEGDVLIGMDGSKVGKNFAKVKRSDLPLLLVQRVACLRAKESISQDFIVYLIMNKKFSNYVDVIKTGTSIPHISSKQIQEYPIVLPPILEQQKIASILKSLDDKIELLHETNETLEQIAQALFKHWFINFEFPDENGNPYRSSGGAMKPSPMGMIPEDWDVGQFSRIINITSGKRPEQKSEYKTHDYSIPLIGASSIMGFVKEPLYKSPILVIGRVGTHGIVQRMTCPCYPSDNTLVINSAYYSYVYQLLNSIDYRHLNVGSTQPLITQSSIKQYEITIPKEDILKKYENITSILFKKIDVNLKNIQSLTELRDLLLPRLMSGKIRVPVKEGDEPCQA